MQQCNKATFSPNLGVHTAPYQWVPALFAWGVKRPGSEVDDSPLSSSEVYNE